MTPSVLVTHFLKNSAEFNKAMAIQDISDHPTKSTIHYGQSHRKAEEAIKHNVYKSKCYKSVTTRGSANGCNSV